MLDPGLQPHLARAHLDTGEALAQDLRKKKEKSKRGVKGTCHMSNEVAVGGQKCEATEV